MKLRFPNPKKYQEEHKLNIHPGYLKEVERFDAILVLTAFLWGVFIGMIL